MSQSADHAQFRKGGFVSLWLGSIPDEDDLDGYLKSGFESDFGFVIDPRDGPEYDISRESKPIRSLLEGFSSSGSFTDAAIETTQLMGWTEANTALVFYHFKYDSDYDQSTGESPLHFIGVFRFAGFG